ncbi:MAG TPA: amidase family protein [Kofleriaceae bacterium]|jgi:amidase|nr:amidase family protein [Kofleriaceae bacterium]
MKAHEYAGHDGLGLAALVTRGEVSPAELLEAAIACIERHNGTLNAVVYKAYDEARRTAAGALPDGPFKGVPFLVKDLGRRVKGWPCSNGSVFAQAGPAGDDSVLVKRYREAGVILVGTTNTPEFGIPGVTHSQRLGLCKNPWNPAHTPGGSSGGAAAAVASGMVPIAHASDGLGSIRIPAACCGLVGLKPTRERNPWDPDGIGRGCGLVVDHIVARSVRDCAAMLDVTGYPQPASPYASPPKAGPYLDELARAPGKLRITWSSQTPTGRPIDAEIDQALSATVELLAALGHDVQPRVLEVDQLALYLAARTMLAANFAAEMKAVIARIGREPGNGELGQLARRNYEAGKQVSGADAFAAADRVRALSWQILDEFQAFDVYVTPVLGTLPPRTDELDPVATDLKTFDSRTATSFPFTAPFNMTGQPAISLPLAQSRSGLPIGIMFAARYGDEATLFRLAAQLEQARPWASRRPELWG